MKQNSYTISDSHINHWLHTNFDHLTISSWSEEEYIHFAHKARKALIHQITEEMIFQDEILHHKPYVSYQETDYDNLYSG